LNEALNLLAKGAVVGGVLAFLFESAPFISPWFQGLAANAKWWIVFVLSMLLPLSAQLVLDFVPPEALATVQPYFQALGFGFVAWAGAQGVHVVDKTLRANGS